MRHREGDPLQDKSALLYIRAEQLLAHRWIGRAVGKVEGNSVRLREQEAVSPLKGGDLSQWEASEILRSLVGGAEVKTLMLAELNASEGSSGEDLEASKGINMDLDTPW